MIRLLPFSSKKSSIFKKEHPSSSFVPYKYHWNENTILLQEDVLLQVVKLDGFSFETSDDEDVDLKKDIRNQLFRGMASGSFALYFHTVRRKRNIFDDGFAERKLNNHFVDYLNQEWKKKYKKNKGFVNELYITIIRKNDTSGAAFVQHLIKKFGQKASKNAWEADMIEMQEELEEAVSRVLASLRDYNPRVLGLNITPDGIYSEVVAFLTKLVNFSTNDKILLSSEFIAKQLFTNRLYFGKKSIEVVTPLARKYAGIISVKEYGQYTFAGVMDVFLQFPYELIISQSFSFINRQIAVSKMQLQQARMIQTEDKSISQVADITRALDEATSGKISFGEHHLSIMCVEKSITALENAMSLAEVELSNTGMYSIREKVNMEAAFWGQLPGNFPFVARKAVVNTLNLASFASQHNYPSGQKKNNHWGEAVTVFNTTSGTPFFFNFHVRDVGHTTIIGPTGAGKTVLMNFLCAQSIKFRPRIFFFDKDRGADIFIRSVGGKYTIIEPRSNTGFNPLQLEDTAENRTFLMEWMQCLAKTYSEDLSANDISLITDAVEGNFKLDKKDRRLRNLLPFFGLPGSGSLLERVGIWHSEGSHSKIFDNEIDDLNLFSHQVFGFEMAHLLKDKAALGPVLLYVFHRITLALDGTPCMIVLDEAWALIDNPIFAPKIKDWLKVLRKLNTFVIFATQSVEDASNSAISDTLIQQAATQIFLPNLKATDTYRRVFMLSAREFILIKTTDPGSRFFLIKQGINAVVAKLDLKGMEGIISVLSGRAETVLLLDEIRQEVGDDVKKWLPIFIKRAAHV